MIVTTTAVGFTLLALGVAVCGWRFLVAFRKVGKSQGKIGLILSTFFFTGALQNGVLGIGALFFSTNADALYSIILLSHTFLAFLAIISTYMAFYMLFPKKSAAVHITMVGILGTLFILLTIIIHPQPTLTYQNGIDWGISSPLSYAMFLLFFISLAPPAYIFSKLFKSTNNKELKQTSIIIAVLCGGGIINVFTRLVMLQGSFIALRTRLLDIGVAVIGLGFIIVSVIQPIFTSRSFDRHVRSQMGKARIYDI